jgi:influenza virus NS1A-binding protein
MYYFIDGHNNIEKLVPSKNMVPSLNGCDPGAIFIMEDDDHQTVLLNSLNMMRKSRTFCDVILNVS